VFYGTYESEQMWGKDLYAYLDDIYRNTARYCVVFISKHYASKLWTNHERRSAQARAFSQNKEYLLPARFDDAELPGLPPTVGYLDLRKVKPADLGKRIVKKLGPLVRVDFLPPNPDKLFKRMKLKTDTKREAVYASAYSFVDAVRRMDQDERTLIANVFLHGCPADLPENVHISIDLLHRITGFPTSKILRVLGGMRSLGFTTRIRNDRDHDPRRLGENTLVEVEFAALVAGTDPRIEDTLVASELVDCAVGDLCQECGTQALLRGDFSQLASVTTQSERHPKRKRRERNARLRMDRAPAHAI
jgi:hypothetical protein